MGKKCYLTREKITVAICHCCLHKIITFFFAAKKYFNGNFIGVRTNRTLQLAAWKYEISLQVLL